MTRQVFSTFFVARFFGVPYPTVRDWLERGYITASGSRAHGRGTRTRFTYADLYRVKLFMLLIQWGFSRDIAKNWGGSPSMDGVLQNTKLIVVFDDGTNSPTIAFDPKIEGILPLSMKGKTLDGREAYFRSILQLNWEREKQEIDRGIEE